MLGRYLMRKWGSLSGCTAAVFLLSLVACGPETNQASGNNPSCAELSAKRSINEQCAIEIAKAEVAKRGQVSYSRFSARFDEDEKLWVVIAIREPEMPGAHVYVDVGTDGRIHGYTLGQ